MKNISNYILKIILVVALLIAMNYIYKYFFFEKDLQQYSDIINLTREVVLDNNEIVYIGESSNTTSRYDDIDKRPISDFISEYFPEKNMGDISKEATHAEIYYELLRNIPEASNVKTVIVTLNLRSFDADWIYSKLETPLQKRIVLLKDFPPLFNRAILSFKGYDIKSDEERAKQVNNEWKKSELKFPYPFPYKNVLEWVKAIEEKVIYNADNTINYKITTLAGYYVKTYAFQIDTLSNPRIKDFDKIVKLAKERNWNLIFNLMAENVQKANELVGEDLTFLMYENRDLLIDRYQRMGVLVVDNMDLIDDEQFIDQDWTTEHYAEEGRKIIAKNVAQALKLIYPSYYKEIIYLNNKTYNFFNDCEGNNAWGQEQTLTREKAYSKNKSSKTGNGQYFGYTFEYAKKNLPDSITQVHISMYVYQTEIDPDIKMVFELSGDNIEYTWNNVSLSSITSETNKWVKVEKTFELDDIYENSSIVKVYLYNSTNNIVYVDDINILFE